MGSVDSGWNPPAAVNPGADVTTCSPYDLTSSMGGYNPYCNMIVGLCTNEPGNADYETHCPNAQHANYIYDDNGNKTYYNTCLQQPIQQCTLYGTGVSSPIPAARICSAQNVGACWSRSLCNAVGASWQAVQGQGGTFICTNNPACPANTNIGAQVACSGCGDATSCNTTMLAAPLANSDLECACCYSASVNSATGKCNLDAKCVDSSGNACVCAAGPVPQQINSKDPTVRTCTWGCGVPAGDTGCGWASQTSQCLLQCSPQANVCDNCGGSLCDAPCFWTSEDACAEHSGSQTACTAASSSVGGGCAWSAPTSTCASACAGLAGPTGTQTASQSTCASNAGCFWNEVGGASGTGACQPATGVCMLGSNLCEGISPGCGASPTSVTSTNSTSSANSAKSVARLSAKSNSSVSAKVKAKANVAALKKIGKSRLAQSNKSNKGSTTNTTSAFPTTLETAVHAVRDAVGSSAYTSAVNQSLQRVACVRMPTGFVNNATPATYQNTTSAVTGCLPNVFVPSLSAGGGANVVSLFRNQANYPPVSAGASSGNIKQCYSGSSNTSFSGGSNQSASFLYNTTCLASSSTTATTTDLPTPTVAMDFCGCNQSIAAGDDATCGTGTTYGNYDRLCWVDPSSGANTALGSGVQGGFTLRQASAFGANGGGQSDTNGVYDALYTTPDSDLFNYVALPSTNIDLWVQANTTTAQQTRLFMILRIYYWILLTTATDMQTLSQLGLSTFLNNAGYDEDKNLPYVPLSSDTATLAASLSFYSTQPLLVYEKDAAGKYTSPAFYTMQELKEGIYSQDGECSTSAAPAAVPNATTLLTQLSMWTYDSTKAGLQGNVARDGMTSSTVNTSSASLQVQEGQQLRGLMQGTFGYCNMWFTENAFVGGTIGAAAAMLAIAVVYVVLYNKFIKK